jgi:hypothetical protein
MTHDSEDQGFRYTLWVCNLADDVARRIETARRWSFRYRSANLKQAFKKSIYFLLINDPDAYAVFTAERRGESAPAFDRSTAGGEILAEYLSSRRRAGLRKQLSDLVSATREFARTAIDCFSTHPQSGPFWAIAIQPKFADHLLPILKSLGAPYRFVTFDDPRTDQYLEGLGIPPLNLGAGKQTITDGPLRTDAGLVRTHAVAFDAISRRMKEERPAGIVLSEGNAPVYAVVNEAARQLKIPVVCIQQGWSPIVHTGFRDLQFTKFAVWGEWFASALAPSNPRQRFVATGHHQIEVRAPKTGKPKTVGFFLQRGSRLLSDEVWREMLELVEFAATQLPQARVLVRDHPNGPLTDAELARWAGIPAIRHMPPSACPLQEVLGQCDLVVSIFSTTILEAIGVGALPLIVNVTSMPNYNPDLDAIGAALEVKTFAEAREALLKLWSDGVAPFARNIEMQQHKLFTRAGEEALALIASCLRREFRLPLPAENRL